MLEFDRKWKSDDKTITDPLRWRKASRVRIEMDLFHESVPDEWIDRVFAVMALAPQHIFQILTKRMGRARKYFEERADGDPWADATDEIADILGMKDHPAVLEPKDIPLPNVWLGVTAEDQARADERIPDLLATPAAKRFVSCEPLLGQIDLNGIAYPHSQRFPITDNIADEFTAIGNAMQRRLDWVIAGGESGPKARPNHPDWFRSLRDQCAAARVPFFFKQWGEWIAGPVVDDSTFSGGRRVDTPLVKWAISGRGVRYIGEDFAAINVGKRRAGSLLDGREHKEFPA